MAPRKALPWRAKPLIHLAFLEITEVYVSLP
jgi:hypothetical protein